MTDKSILSITIEFKEDSRCNYPVNICVKSQGEYDLESYTDIPIYHLGAEIKALIDKISTYNQ